MRARFLVLLSLAAALLLVAATSQTSASATQAFVDPQLRDALASTTEPVEAVVTFTHDGAPTAADVAALRDAGITRGFTFQALPSAGVLATAEQVDALAASPEVASVYSNRPLQYENEEATALTGVDRVRNDARFTQRNGGFPISGLGAGILVNDSGIDGLHKDLEFGPHLVQNVEAAANPHAFADILPIVYVENVPNTDATGGHGTHVAGIAGGTGALSNGKYEGVAPGAPLVGYGSGAALFILDALGGFDYAIANQAQYGIRVITNSWGDTGDRCTPVNPDDPITRATKNAYNRGIVVVFSAGNSGRSGECTITGNYKKAPWVIAVAAGDKQRNLADFSSRGSPGGGGTVTIDGKTWRWVDQPTLTAPGVLIISTRTISPIGVIGTDDDLAGIPPQYLPYYTTLSGTSMAAPHVAGVVALMLDANPSLTPLQVKSILQKTATSMPYAAWEAGAGYVDAYGAVSRAFR
jgi:serine protease AprX